MIASQQSFTVLSGVGTNRKIVLDVDQFHDVVLLGIEEIRLKISINIPFNGIVAIPEKVSDLFVAEGVIERKYSLLECWS